MTSDQRQQWILTSDQCFMWEESSWGHWSLSSDTDIMIGLNNITQDQHQHHYTHKTFTFIFDASVTNLSNIQNRERNVTVALEASDK